MKINEVIEYFGTQTEVCHHLKIHRQNFTQWKSRGYIPYKHQKRLEKLTGARLKADIHVLEHYWENHSESVTKGKIIKKGTTND
jgi:hypothetical protein